MRIKISFLFYFLFCSWGLSFVTGALGSVAQKEFMEVPADQKIVKLHLKMNEGKGLTVLFSKKLFNLELTLLDQNHKLLHAFSLSYTHLLKTGKVIFNDNLEEVFFAGLDGGTGSHTVSLYLLKPSIPALVSLSLQFSHQATEPLPVLKRSPNFYTSHFQQERKFLETMKYDYGVFDQKKINQNKNNPDFACYFWARDNANISNGAMKIRKFSGTPAELNSINDKCEDGGMVYTAYFKGPVVAYDVVKNEHFILFHPRDMYAWPTVLKKEGHFLIIGTRGEGLALIDLGNFHLRRYSFGNENDDVKSLKISDRKIIVNNAKEVPFYFAS